MIYHTLITFLLFSTIIFQTVRGQETCTALTETFALIKPDAVAARNSGYIVALIELNGFTITRMEKRLLKTKEAEKFYSEHQGKPFFKELVDYITSGPVIALVLKKENAIADWRALMGATNPQQALVGTIRKMFGTNKTFNAVHGSDSAESAKREINFFWNKKAKK